MEGPLGLVPQEDRASHTLPMAGSTAGRHMIGWSTQPMTAAGMTASHCALATPAGRLCLLSQPAELQENTLPSAHVCVSLTCEKKGQLTSHDLEESTSLSASSKSISSDQLCFASDKQII